MVNDTDDELLAYFDDLGAPPVEPHVLFLSGQVNRRAALMGRMDKIADIITAAPVDRLGELESWFDEVEEAFAPTPAWAQEALW